ncbi:hypothetical protein ACJMK2_043488, partial [Sinanodonta woodiana]
MESIESSTNFIDDILMANDTITFLENDYEYVEFDRLKELSKNALIIFIIVLGLITVNGLVGNILTVAVIFRHKGFKSITDILVLTLAVTDILLIVFGVPNTLLGYFTNIYSDGRVWYGLTEYVEYACSYA